MLKYNELKHLSMTKVKVAEGKNISEQNIFQSVGKQKMRKGIWEIWVWQNMQQTNVETSYF